MINLACTFKVVLLSVVAAAGFLYGYNPEVCEDRSGITAQVMVGGPFVDAVFAAEDA